jgi:hypothetical protein
MLKSHSFFLNFAAKPQFRLHPLVLQRRLRGRAAKATAVTYNQAIVHPAPGVLVNAVLTGAVGFSSKRSLIEKFAVTGPVPGVRPALA